LEFVQQFAAIANLNLLVMSNRRREALVQRMLEPAIRHSPEFLPREASCPCLLPFFF